MSADNLSDYDLVFVDTPGSLEGHDVLDAVLTASDFVILPTEPAALAVMPLIRSVRDVVVPRGVPYRVLLNIVDPRSPTELEEARQLLDSQGIAYFNAAVREYKAHKHTEEAPPPAALHTAAAPAASTAVGNSGGRGRALPAPDTGGDTSESDVERDQPAADLPRYLQLERKELRVRLDQADELARLTRRLNRARGRTGERITDNTLIRVAIDLLLQNAGRLSGSTEDELRGSVTLSLRD